MKRRTGESAGSGESGGPAQKAFAVQNAHFPSEAGSRKAVAIRARVIQEGCPNKSLINSSGLFKARSLILFPVEAGPRLSWRGSDGPHRIFCALHSWCGFHDLRAVSVDLGRQAPHHCTPGGGTPEGV
jgi:hypothetical protein